MPPGAAPRETGDPTASVLRELGASEAAGVLQRLFAEHHAPQVLVDAASGDVLEINRAAGKTLGLAPGAGRGKPLESLLPGADRLPRCAFLIGDRRLFHIYLDTAAVSPPSPDPAPEDRPADAGVRSLRSQKMEALGRLAGGVAHDFNNLLMAIEARCELLRAEFEPGSAAAEEVQAIRQTGMRAAALTRQLLAFSRSQVLSPQDVDLNGIVERAQRLLGRVLGEDVVLSTELEPEAWWIHADPAQVEQVLINLALNARDAMVHGGRLRIATANVVFGSSDAPRRLGGEAGDWVRLTVEDTGVGISPEIQEQIFEPFFSTKKSGRGVGLGLAAVYGIVQQTGGFIEVRSQPGKGSSFRVYFPRVAPRRAAPAPATGTGRRPRGSETILLVEDEAAVRRPLARLLEGQGYRVLEADNGDRALELERDHAGEIHLLLTDVVMPGLSGGELARQMLERRPGLRTIFMSGYANARTGDAGRALEGAASLHKPFTPGTLIRLIRSQLDSR